MHPLAGTFTLLCATKQRNRLLVMNVGNVISETHTLGDTWLSTREKTLFPVVPVIKHFHDRKI